MESLSKEQANGKSEARTLQLKDKVAANYTELLGDADTFTSASNLTDSSSARICAESAAGNGHSCEP
jgi:hypothetical protein